MKRGKDKTVSDGHGGIAANASYKVVYWISLNCDWITFFVFLVSKKKRKKKIRQLLCESDQIVPRDMFRPMKTGGN